MCGSATLAMVESSVTMVAASMVDAVISIRRVGSGYWMAGKLWNPDAAVRQNPLGQAAGLVNKRQNKCGEMQ